MELDPNPANLNVAFDGIGDDLKRDRLLMTCTMQCGGSKEPDVVLSPAMSHQFVDEPARRRAPRRPILSRHHDEEFTARAMDLEEVQECYLVSGNFDYLLKARVANMNAYRVLLGETLLTLPGVQESTSYVVMEQVKESLTLPVPA